MDLVPLKKPYTLEEFKRKTDLYLQGMFGTSDKQFYIDKITEEYDKAKDAGLDTKAGIEFIKERNKMYKTLADEGRMQGDPAILGPSYGSTREEFSNGTKSKSAVRKPFAPEIEKRIIELANNNKLGAEAIAKKLTEEFNTNFSRSPVGKRIKILRDEGKIKNIPVSERQASIDMRGKFYDKPAKEKYLAVREIRDVDRKAIDRFTGASKFNIPKDAKFKVDFKNTGANFADVSNIPEEFRGVQYFKTKAAAEEAVAKRKKLKLIGDEDLDPIKRKANKKKYDLIKEVSDNNIERVLADFKKGEPLEKAHRLSLNQVRKTGEMYNVMNLGLDFDDPKFVQINNEFIKPYENKLKQLYTEQNNLYKKASNLKTIPKELRKQIEFNNKKISTVVDLAGGRVQGLQLDEFTLKPKVTGVNYANVLGFGLYDKPVAQLTKEDRAAIGVIMQSQIENEKRTAGKTAARLFENKESLKNIDTLAIKGMVPGITTADQAPEPEKSKIRNMFKQFGKYAKPISKAALRAVGPFIPIAGTAATALGVADVAKAAEQGLKDESLGIAYLLGPEKAKQYSEFKGRIKGKEDDTGIFVP